MAGTYRKTSATGLGQKANATGFEIEGGSTKATLTVSADVTLDQDLQQSASPTFAGLTIDANAITSIEDVAATLTDNDAALPTSAAIIDYVAGEMASAGMAWAEVTADTSPTVVGNGYICNKAGTMCACVLPAAAAVGERIGFLCKGATGFSIQAAAGDTIQLPGQISIAAGIVRTVDTHVGFCLILQCVTADTAWNSEVVIGNFEVETA
jgi:hypothetical protein